MGARSILRSLSEFFIMFKKKKNFEIPALSCILVLPVKKLILYFSRYMLRFRPVRCYLSFSPGSKLHGVFGFDVSSCFSWVLFFLLGLKYAYYSNEQATKISLVLENLALFFQPFYPALPIALWVLSLKPRSSSAARWGAALSVSRRTKWVHLTCHISITES